MNKEWYKSKTVWVSLTALVLVILQAMGIAIPEVAYKVLAALGLYTLRAGIGTEIK